MAEKDTRVSAEQERKLEGGEATAPPPAKPEAPKNDIHPAFYIAYAIFHSPARILSHANPTAGSGSVSVEV